VAHPFPFYRKPGSPPALLVGWKGWVIRAKREPLFSQSKSTVTFHTQNTKARSLKPQHRLHARASATMME
jgi:hypothetical protein